MRLNSEASRDLFLDSLLNSMRLFEPLSYELSAFYSAMEPKDILHVMRMLGHRNINNTLRYTQLIKTEDNEFISKVAKSVKEICALIDAGYEYVTEFKEEGIKIFRKRK